MVRKESDKSLQGALPKPAVRTGSPQVAGFFLLVWPTFNLSFFSLVLLQVDFLEFRALSNVAPLIYATFWLAYALILLLQRLFPIALSEYKFWPQLALHVGAFLLIGRFFGPMLDRTGGAPMPQPSIVPLVITVFQITLYVLVKHLIQQREHHLATQLNLRETKINMLRSQSNPHFLFNTLNLLASEIKRNPENAQDIVYDLADLLRESMRAAERNVISLEEELRLAELYLRLQKKRFPDRLVFTIDVEDRCRELIVPSLLLQPVIENIVKHVIARSNTTTSVRLCANARNNRLVIQVLDSGPRFDSTAIKPKEGLRIVHETLALHYHGQANMALESRPEGGRLTINLPLQQTLPGH